MRWAFMPALLLLPGGISRAGQDKPQTETILFVCEHGSAKSVIAAAHFKRLAEQRGLPHRAIARGINPDPEIPESSQSQSRKRRTGCCNLEAREGRRKGRSGSGARRDVRLQSAVFSEHH